MPRALIISVLSLLLCAERAVGHLAQSPDVDIVRYTIAYHLAADQYRAGNTEAAAATIERLDRKRLKTVVARLKVMRFVPGPYTMFAWDRPTLLSAGMLHVDLAMAAYLTRRTPDFWVHADLAAELLAIADTPRAGSDETQGTAARRSAVAIGLRLLGDGTLVLGRQYLEGAVVRFPDDIRLLVSYGTLNETEATSHMAPSEVNAPAMFTRVRAARDQTLHQATELFERALAIDPAHVEARVRLGHVRTLEHDDAAALLLLNEALAAQPPAAWVYVARLMVGGIQERAGRGDSALQLYRAAIAVQPDGQSAYIALSQALQRAGDGKGAADVLAHLFKRHLTMVSDNPWWGYPYGKWRDAEPMLAALRAEARQ